MESETISQPAPPQNTAVPRIVFFCKDCEKLVEGAKIGRKYVYRYSLCHTKDVAFGTEKSIRTFYRVKEEQQ